MAFKKILVAIDRSPLSPAVFEQALDLAQKESASLMLFHCISWQGEGEMTSMIGTSLGFEVGSGMGLDPTEGLMGQALQQERLQNELEQVQGWLDSHGQKAADLKIPSESYYKVGEPGSSICEVAQKWGADLIVLGRHSHTVLTEMLMGSVSNYVFHHASCSVLAIQGVTPPAQE